MTNTYVAVDIGASSGRLMLSQLKDGKMSLKEMHRFTNGFSFKQGHDRWDIDHIIKEILLGLEKIKQAGYPDISLGIDTWAVDYVLVGKDGKKLEDPISYRDARTNTAIKDLTARVSKEKIYQKTGIQFLDFNTLYQLFKEDKDLLAKTDKIMMIPDYIGYVLTGKAVSEVTNASTTQMLSLREGLFDKNLLKEVNVKPEQFPKLVDAGTPLGKLDKSKFSKYDLPDTDLITVASHDTASAVVGSPGMGHHWAYLSSGTWSLIGTELNVPENGSKAFAENYTNEWGAYGTYRFLKNIMGLWMIQCVRREFNNKYSFSELAEKASTVKPFQQFIDVNDKRFENPKSMISEIKNYCRETGQQIPESPGEICMAIYSNLALFYAQQIQKLNDILGYKIDTLNIVGGGSNVALLNQLTATISGIDVYAGPDEATAIGNLTVQMITKGDILNVYLARRIISDSFDIKKYLPQEEKYHRIFEEYKEFMQKIHQKSN
ncbi:rhamnulokinase [Lactobacillus colini]|uniref:Rhamnulokinase n=1 Tax=Lactobacillus colini TaxID=1819254 RepID=A0ABS4MBT4_9LACO|nr:rhamnulokinase [Lactobacillus colini]MBP2057141.1 rhamnulokinase [Lactobacillus colini]